MAFNIVVFYGSVRSERRGIKVAKWVIRKLEERAHKVTLFDAQELGLPLLDKMYKEYAPDEAPVFLKKMAGPIKEADAFVIVSGEYNHSIPPALSNMLDYFLEEYLWRPSAIVSYSVGRFGGVRAAMQLRALLAEIGMPSISSTFPVAAVHESFDDAGNDKTGGYDGRAGKFLDELEWFAEAYREQRKKGVPY